MRLGCSFQKGMILLWLRNKYVETSVPSHAQMRLGRQERKVNGAVKEKSLKHEETAAITAGFLSHTAI